MHEAGVYELRCAKWKAANHRGGNILQRPIQLKKEDFCLFWSNT